MPTDFFVTQDRDIRIDFTGDYETASGVDNIIEQHANAVFRAVDEINDQLPTQQNLESIKLAIRTELNTLSYVDEIIRINLEATNRTEVQVTIATDALDDPLVREVSL